MRHVLYITPPPTTLLSETAVSRRERLQWSGLWLSLGTRVSGRMNGSTRIVVVVRLDRNADMLYCLISVEWSFISLGIWRTGVRILSTVQLSGINWRCLVVMWFTIQRTFDKAKSIWWFCAVVVCDLTNPTRVGWGQCPLESSLWIKSDCCRLLD